MYRAKTIEQRRILTWLDENSYLSSLAQVEFLGRTIARITDRAGACALVQYEADGSVHLEPIDETA